MQYPRRTSYATAISRIAARSSMHRLHDHVHKKETANAKTDIPHWHDGIEIERRHIETATVSISIWLLSHVLNRVNRFFHSNYLYFITKANIKLCEAYVWVMFRTAVCIFRTAECTFRSGERTFRSAEHRLDTYSCIIIIAIIRTLW